MIYLTLLKRSPIRRKRNSARKNRIHDRAYLAWLSSQRCLISGKPATIHHVRRFGEARNDHRAVPLAPEFHFHATGQFSIERLGKRKFEARHGVNLEAAIKCYNQLYFGTAA